jgi:hypothetical protein
VNIIGFKVKYSRNLIISKVKIECKESLDKTKHALIARKKSL